MYFHYFIQLNIDYMNSTQDIETDNDIPMQIGLELKTEKDHTVYTLDKPILKRCRSQYSDSKHKRIHRAYESTEKVLDADDAFEMELWHRYHPNITIDPSFIQ